MIVTGPTGRTVEPDELLMRMICNADNDRSFSDRASYIITAAVLNTQQIADRVDAARKAAQMTVAKLASVTGIPRTTLRRYLAGQTEFRVSHLMRIGKDLSVPFAALTSGAHIGRS